MESITHVIASQPIKNSSNSLSNSPGNRINHSIISYEFKIYIMGGTSASTPPTEDHYLNIYTFNLQNSGWSKKIYCQLQNKDEDIITRSYMASARIGNKFYLFGGSDKNQCTNQLLCLNLDSIQWEAIKSSNPPSPRQCAKMVAIKKNMLAIYGGVNFNTLKIFEKLYLYHTETGSWTQCLGNYTTIIRPRYQSSICVIQNSIYLFGGEYRTPENRQYYLNDFYKIDLQQIEGNKWQASASLVRVNELKSPQARSSHFLLSYKNQYILLFGGDNVGQENITTCWIFSPKAKNWKNFQLNTSIPKSFGFNCCCETEKIYLYGGISTHDSVKIDLFMIYFTGGINQYFLPKTLPICRQCNYPKQSIKFTKQQSDRYSQLIDFPFAAFGLLLQCSDATHSDMFLVKYRCEVDQPNEAYLQITQNSTLNYTFEQLKSSIMNYESYLNFNPMGPLQKKVRLAINKQNFLKQFGLFIKVSSFRLGDQFIYIIIKNNQIWMFAYFLQDKDSYAFYAFGQRVQDRVMTKGSQRDRTAIYQKYQKQIERMLQKKNLAKNKDHHFHQNYLMIFKLKKIKMENGEFQDIIVPSDNNTDLVLSFYKSNSFFKSQPHMMLQSIDISLKAYLSVFFMKADSIVIKLQVTDRWMFVMPQMFLQSYDHMVKAKTVYQIDNSMVNIDLRIMQLYFNPNLKNVTNTFHNGVLIYHKGKLVERFGCPLGGLVRNKKNGNYNLFNLFGLLEVPETVQVSIFRTTFAYNVMMQKLRSKLKYLQTHIGVNFNQKQIKNPKKVRHSIKGEQGGGFSEISQFSGQKMKIKIKKRDKFSQKKIQPNISFEKPSQHQENPQEKVNLGSSLNINYGQGKRSFQMEIQANQQPNNQNNSKLNQQIQIQKSPSPIQQVVEPKAQSDGNQNKQ